MMRFWRTACLVSLGGLAETIWALSGHSTPMLNHQEPLWTAAVVVTACGWGWAALGVTLNSLSQRLVSLLTGRPQALPKTDPKALAAEVAALNAQIASLRDTATSFDVSFDQTLQRLDERLRRMEQQSSYVQAGRSQ